MEKEHALTPPGSVSDPRLSRRLRFAGILLILGLLTELATLFSAHPLAFLAFLLLGGLLVGAGVLLYLFAIVSQPGAPRAAGEA